MAIFEEKGKIPEMMVMEYLPGEEISVDIKKGLEIVFVEQIEEVLDVALVKYS